MFWSNFLDTPRRRSSRYKPHNGDVEEMKLPVLFSREAGQQVKSLSIQQNDA